MMRPDHIGLLGFIVAMGMSLLFYGFGDLVPAPAGDSPSARRPAAIAPEPAPDTARRQGRAPLPGASPLDPTVDVALGQKGNSVGSAFSVGDGVWLTARHVVDGCNRFGILTGARKGEAGRELIFQPNADLALFRTRSKAPALAVESGGLSLGEAGFHLGFPRGQPGAVESTLLGRVTIRQSGRYRTREPGIAWAEKQRIPDFDGSLGGISGGPVLDADGRVVGVQVAESRRRGRIMTSDPATLAALLEKAGVRAVRSGGAVSRPIDQTRLAAVGEQLRQGLTVAKVVCEAG